MHGASSLPETTAPALDSGATHSPLTGSTDLERLWEGKSDDALEEASQDLASYTDEGQRVIRAELQRRSMEAPVAEEANGERDEFKGTGVRVYSGPVLANLAILKDVLESYGIACEIRREYLGGAAGELPPIETWPELWLLDGSQVEQARQLVQEALEPPKTTSSWNWTCPECREDIESQFSECWNCGSERPPAPGI